MNFFCLTGKAFILKEVPCNLNNNFAFQVNPPPPFLILLIEIQTKARHSVVPCWMESVL